jgi:dolichol-phosphate mannosyltransferase
LTLARGDVVAVMDCDLQDPPEVLPGFLEKWREGYQVVYAIRGKRKEWFGKRLAYWGFYRLLSAISELDIPLDSGDFCVMDRRAVDLLNSMPESQRFVRGLRTWVGLRQTGVYYERDARHAGRPAYTFKALRRLAMDGLVSFSTVPLVLVRRMGMLAAVTAVALGLLVVVGRLVVGSNRLPPWGWSSLACLILMASSVQLLSLGVIGEYLARIFIEVKRRPTYLIADVVEQKPLDDVKSGEVAVEAEVAEALEVKMPERVVESVAAEINPAPPVEVVEAEAAPAPKFYFVADKRQVLVKGIRVRSRPGKPDELPRES